MGVLIIANFADFDEGGKTGLEGAKNIDPLHIPISKISLFVNDIVEF